MKITFSALFIVTGLVFLAQVSHISSCPSSSDDRFPDYPYPLYRKSMPGPSAYSEGSNPNGNYPENKDRRNGQGDNW